MNSSTNILEVRNLKVWFGKKNKPVKAVDDVSFVIPADSTVALVGESGCGKSVTALSLVKLVPSPPANYLGGEVILNGRNISAMSEKSLYKVRGREIAYVFQEPSVALNPVVRVGNQIKEAVKLCGGGNADDEALKLAEMVGLPNPSYTLRRYPHELSGGMQQRVMIAMALASRPSLLVADEPTTALDVTIQAQILELLVSLQKKMKMAILLITHNFGLVAETADWLYVMYAGRIIEAGPTENVLAEPLHPYTRELLNAVPRLNTSGTMQGIEGTVPDLACLPSGCRFAPRCKYVKENCLKEEPSLLFNFNRNRSVRCFYPLADEGILKNGRIN